MTPNSKYVQRTIDMPISFVREILKVTDDKSIISFAGGLPAPSTFPLEKLKVAADKAIDVLGVSLFQYGKTTGFEPLKQWISERYKLKYGLNIDTSEILLTNGSQQGIDIISKVFLNKGDGLVMEEPGYLGAIQAYHAYEPKIIPVPLERDGISIDELKKALQTNKPKLVHIIPNHQNPTGISYSKEKKQQALQMAEKHDTIIVEDDPYAEINFDGPTSLPPAIAGFKDRAIHLGSFSKTVAPGLRLGWIVAKKTWIDKMEIAKQASDLHTNNISQAMIYQLLCSIDFDAHTRSISQLYQERAITMVAAIRSYFPSSTNLIEPKGGMFIWCELEEQLNTRRLLETVMGQCVFVPGDVFHISPGMGHNTMRLNFSNAAPEEIIRGISLIGTAIKKQLHDVS